MTSNQNATVTAIIPVLGDTEQLARLLKIMAGMTDPPEETIVVDGADNPECRNLCEHYALNYVATRPGRGHQLNVGAKMAGGQVLWFVHADATPAGNSTRMIREFIAQGGIGGYFRFHFAGPTSFMKEMLAKLINFRARYGTPYGDQGLFATRLAYINVGGFPDDPLFEEVPFVRRLRCIGRFSELPAMIGVSQRRWQRDGWVRRTLANRLMAFGYMFGMSPEALARRYRPLSPADKPSDRSPGNRIST